MAAAITAEVGRSRTVRSGWFPAYLVLDGRCIEAEIATGPITTLIGRFVNSCDQALETRQVKFLIAVISYFIITFVLFGDPFQPIVLAVWFPDRLGIPFWPIIAAIIIWVMFLVYRSTLKTLVPELLGPAFFVFISVSVPTIIIGIYAEAIKLNSILALEADYVEDHWFFASLHNAPTEYQFFLHAAALKNCVPYAWSYRELAFYVVPPNVAVNVLPHDWITRCGIIRTQR